MSEAMVPCPGVDFLVSLLCGSGSKAIDGQQKPAEAFGRNIAKN